MITATTCSPMLYDGTVCQTALQEYQGCLTDRMDSSMIFISPQTGDQRDLEEQAQRLLVGLQLLSPSPMCLTAALPLLCLYYFGLCDSSGELYLPSSGECETLTTETCAREWAMAQTLLGIDQLPQCNSLPATSTLCNGMCICIISDMVTNFTSGVTVTKMVVAMRQSRNQFAIASTSY